MPPPNPAVLLKQALTHHQAGRFASAAVVYAQARQVAPQSFDAWHLGGLALFQAGRADEALPLLARAVQLSPRSALAHFRLGVVRAARGDLDAALAAVQKAVELDPKLVDAWEHLSSLRQRAGQMAGALAAAVSVAELKPSCAEAYNRVATLTVEVRGMGVAHSLFAEATRRWPEHAVSWQNYGIALATLHEPDAALAALDKALALDGKLNLARVGRGLALQEAFRVREALVAYEEVLRHEPGHAETASARLLCLNYLEERTAAELFAAHLEYGRRQAVAKPAVLRPRELKGPLRVAVLSQDFRRHAVAAFFEPLLEHFDPADVEIWLYHDHAVIDEVSTRLQTLARRWRHVAGLAGERVEALLRADAPDVLIDLSGHTGRNRLPLFARRLAPVQITYLGYPNTSGLAEMDYRFTDEHADPAGLTDAFYTEKLVRFAPCAWSFRPSASAPEASMPRAAADPERAVVFGSFNNPAKLSDFTLRLWAEVLAATPGSRLLLKGHGLETPARRRELEQRCLAAGMDVSSLDLLGRTVGAGDHLGLYQRIDIALDPFPYHGTTTTCEALWMGRPVVSLIGQEHRSRVGASLLQAAGHSEWAVASAAEYVRVATALAADRAGLARIAAGLRGKLAAGPLFDYAAQAKAFSKALQACHEEARSRATRT
ncbi:MAG: tetratricopeptide repeat protein [Verrucomicrobia bacterium]|nr:tetratricopeptide repeat protein [Verrucomicrobiota bacterium]